MATVLTILNALIAIPKIAGYVELLAQTITGWWIQRQNQATQAAIVDALALTMRAQTEEDRYAAAQKWQDVFTHSRVSS